jgi:hypothetical protein
VCPMSEIEQFWLYAKEAALSASDAETAEETQSLLDLAKVWTQAALRARAASSDQENPASLAAAC